MQLPSGELYLNSIKSQKFSLTDAFRGTVPISPNFLDLLPVDCLLKIAEFLPIHVRLKGMSTCKQWKEILSAEQFWIYIGMPPLIPGTFLFHAQICFVSLRLIFDYCFRPFAYFWPDFWWICEEDSAPIWKNCSDFGSWWLPSPHRQCPENNCDVAFFTQCFLEMVSQKLYLHSRSTFFLNKYFDCRCDRIIESDLLRHLQIHGRRYEKIDLRGCNKLTGTVLFRECEKRALSEGLIKSEAIFDCKETHQLITIFVR